MTAKMKQGHLPTAAELEAALAPVEAVRPLRRLPSTYLGPAGLSDEELEVTQLPCMRPRLSPAVKKYVNVDIEHG